MDTFEKVWALVRKIPKGSVTTYGWVGRQLGVSPRVVGFALHRNEDPEIPCHRVFNRDGRVAVNYAFGGGEKQKEKLLLEGVEFIDDIHVNLRNCLWNTVKSGKTHA